MHIKSILTAAAIALAATVGSASAAEQFTTLDGIAVAAMNAMELDSVRGATDIPVRFTVIRVDLDSDTLIFTMGDDPGHVPPPIIIVNEVVRGLGL